MLSKENLPRISIITVVYNGENYLEKTIESVLAQTYGNIEYIIIDGGSSDNTLAIIKKYEPQLSQWLSEKDHGIYDAMNKGLKLATGNWVNFLNGGDVYVDNAVLEKIFSESRQDYDFIYGDAINVAPDFQHYIKAGSVSRASLRSGMEVCHQSIFTRRSITPFYDLRYRFKAEYNWVIDIFGKIELSRSLHVDIPVVYYALGGFSEKGLLKNLREYIALTWKRFGLFQVIKNCPMYILLFMRHIKYKLFGYGIRSH